MILDYKKQNDFKWEKRKGFFSDTPIEQFKVYESLDDKIYYSYPIVRMDGNNRFYIAVDIQICDSMEEGILKCEEIWNNFKEQVNQV